MCGLARRSKYPEFHEFIHDIDILCFVESKGDDCDVIEIPGFEVYMENRKDFSNYRSGGITVVAYKSEIAKFITNIETESKYVKWLKIDKQLLNFTDKGDAILGVVYIPPEITASCIGDPYSEIENEYEMFSATFKNMFIG